MASTSMPLMSIAGYVHKLRLHTGLGFQLGRLTKWITAERYRGLYNFDVQFVGEAGPRGMMLELDGQKTAYNASARSNASEGTWFFVAKAT